MNVEDLKDLNKNKKLAKKLAKEHQAFLASESVIKQISRLLGSGLNKAGRCSSSTLVSHYDQTHFCCSLLLWIASIFLYCFFVVTIGPISKI